MTMLGVEARAIVHVSGTLLEVDELGELWEDRETVERILGLVGHDVPQEDYYEVVYTIDHAGSLEVYCIFCELGEDHIGCKPTVRPAYSESTAGFSACFLPESFVSHIVSREAIPLNRDLFYEGWEVSYGL